MDLTILIEYLNVVIVGICLCVGYMIKYLEFIPNKFIPLIMGFLGLALNIFVNMPFGITLEVILTGLFSGLASTGMYEMFKNLISKGE